LSWAETTADRTPSDFGKEELYMTHVFTHLTVYVKKTDQNGLLKEIFEDVSITSLTNGS
jgi:hypothetical protein